MVNNEVRIIKHQNSHDINKVEFSLNEIKVDIDTRLLNKINRQNKRSK